jgi:hypothetical protein
MYSEAYDPDGQNSNNGRRQDNSSDDGCLLYVFFIIIVCVITHIYGLLGIKFLPALGYAFATTLFLGSIIRNLLFYLLLSFSLFIPITLYLYFDLLRGKAFFIFLISFIILVNKCSINAKIK